MKYLIALLILTGIVTAQEVPYHRLKIWRIKTEVTFEHTIFVYKFQVNKTMVCKAFVQRERIEKDTIGALESKGIAIGVGVALTSLGDVPCE